jgi:hypothetical protein
VTAAGRCAAQNQKEAASPPLTFTTLPRSRLGDAPHEGTGPPLRRQGCCAPLRGGLRPALTPETSAAPQAGNTGRPQPAPPGARRVRQPMPGTPTNARKTK